MLEQQIQKKFLDKINKISWAVKVITSNRNGCPDIILCIQGRFIAVECKRQDGASRALQIVQGDAIRANGGWHYVYDGTFDLFNEILMRLTAEVGIGLTS